jgi:putative redox protein
MTQTAVARIAGGPMRCEIDLDGHTAVTDEPESLGGGDTAPTPQQLLAAALASCVLTTIQMYARRKGWDLSEARVEVCYDPECTEFDIEVQLPASLDEAQRERVLRVAAKCPVQRTLSKSAAVTHRCVVSAA